LAAVQAGFFTKVKINRLDMENGRKSVNLAVMGGFLGFCGSAACANRGKGLGFCGCEMKRPPDSIQRLVSNRD
jgi:hypothetical protein